MRLKGTASQQTRPQLLRHAATAYVLLNEAPGKMSLPETWKCHTGDALSVAHTVPLLHTQLVCSVSTEVFLQLAWLLLGVQFRV